MNTSLLPDLLPPILQLITNINKGFMYYFNLTVIPIGLFLNFISIFAFARKEFHKTTIGFYNIVTCIIDIVLLTFLFIQNYHELIGDDLLLTSSLNCTTFSILARLLGEYSTWVQIIISFDRLYCISCPLKYKEMKYKKIKIPAILIALFILLLISNAFSIFSKQEIGIEFNTISNQTKSYIKCIGPKNLVLIRDVLTLILRLILPFVLLVLSNFIIAYKLAKIRKQFSNFNRFMVKEYKFTISTFVLNVFYIVSLLIYIIYFILLNPIQYDIDFSNGLYVYDMTNRFFVIGQSIITYNYICNFIINVATNVYFRKELVNVLKWLYEEKIQTDESNFKRYTY